MNAPSSDERRKFDRYETDIQIQFYVNFDLKTKINFQVKDKTRKDYSAEKYQALGKNVSAEGVGFISKVKLKKDDRLRMDVFIPAVKDPVVMEGVVRWCQLIEKHPPATELFETGVRITVVNGESVEKTVFIDRIHNIAWSGVLESVFGSFKHAALKRKGLSPSSPNK